MQQQSGQPASAGPGNAGAAAGGQGQPAGGAARPAGQQGAAATSTSASTAGSGPAAAATAAPARPSQPGQAATANPPRAGQPSANATTTPASNAAARPAASTAGTGSTANQQPNLVVVSSSHPRSTPGGGLRPLNVKDALSYLDMVKAKFKGDPDTYNSFLDIMKDFKTQVIDTPGVIDRVSSLFRNHPTLISSFNLFLPEGYCIECLCDPDNRENITSYRVTTPYTTQQLKAGQATSLAGTVLPGQVSLPNYGRPGGPARPAGQAAASTAASSSAGAAATPAAAAGQASRTAAQGPAASTTAAAAAAAAPAHGAARVKTEPVAPAAPVASAATAPVKREEQQQPKGPPAEPLRAMVPSNMSPSGRTVPRRSPPPPMPQAKQAAPAAVPANAAVTAPTSQRPAATTQNSGSNSSLAAPPAASAQGSRTATPGAASALSNSSDSRRPAIEFNHAISYVNKIKNRFQREPEIYKTFLDILQTYQKEQRPIQDVYKQVTSLFRTAPDLLDEFKQFLPDHSAAGQAAEAKAAAAAAQAAGRSGQVRAEETAAAQKRKRAAGGPAQDRMPDAPLSGHPATLAPPPMRSQQIPQQHQQAAQKAVPGGKKVGKGAAAGVKDPPTIAQSSNLRYDGAPPTYPQPILSYLPPGYTLPGSGGSGMVSQAAPPQSQMTGDEHLFFDRVADFIDDKFTYYEFLKLLNLFTQDIIDLPTLVSRAWLFIGSAPDLWLDFRHLVGWQDGLNVNGRTIENGEWIVENTPVVERRTFDLSKAESAGPSYKRLPQSEINMHCSGRDKLCWEVLNDEWLSVMSMGSEEVFMAHRKNPFEEALHRSEDDRYEYDFHIEANLRTIALLEPIAGKIATMTPKERESFRLKPGLGGQSKSLYQRIIKKVYGKEIGREVIAALHENPCVSVPIVLARLKQKDEEWKRALREWNRVWREVDAKNFYRSLDHQGITFKAQDKRYINPKSLVTEIETLRRTEMQKQIAAPLPYRPPAATYQLSYPISDETVLFDSLKLFLSYLDRAPGYHTLAERDRIEAFLRSLTSLVFAIPVSVLDAMLTPVQDDDNSGSLSDDDISDSALSSVDGRQANGKKTALAAGATASGKKLGDLRKKAMKNAGSGEAGSGAGKVRNGLEAAEMTPASSRDTTPVPPAAGEDTQMAGTTAAVDSTNGTASAAEQEANGESSFKTDVPASAAGLDAMTGVEVVRTAVASATQTIEQAQRPRTPSAHSLYDPNAPPETMQLAHDVVENGPMLPPPPTPPTASSSDSAGPTPPQAGQTTPILHNAQRDGQHQIRRFNFFCNTPYYCAIRLLQLLYSRLHTMKESAKSLGSTASDNALNNSSYTKAGKANPRFSGQETPTPSFLYDSMLELCEKLFGSEIDQPTFEDGVRNLFGNKSYHIFTIDKLLSSLVKTVWSLIDSNRETYAANGEIFKLLVDDRRYPTTAQAQQISYRMNAELAAGSDEHLYRIEWLPRRHLLAFQLLGKDEVLPEDESDLSKAWERYIESFIGDDHTKGLPLSNKELMNNVVNQRNLRAVKTQEAAATRPQLFARSDLESRICMRSYRMFWQADTEDAMHRDWPTELDAEGAKDLASKRKARLGRWLEKRNKALEEQAAEKDRKKNENEAADAKISETQGDKTTDRDAQMPDSAEQKKEETANVPADKAAPPETGSPAPTPADAAASSDKPAMAEKGEASSAAAPRTAKEDGKDEQGDSRMDGA